MPTIQPGPELPGQPAAAPESLDAAIAAYEAEGWALLWQRGEMAHLTRGSEGLDLRLDEDGSLVREVIENPSLRLALSGRLQAWLLLLLTLAIVIAVAAALGWLR